MKQFLKKTNRGLVLSAIVLIGLVIYVVADYAMFSSQKDTIKETATKYIDEVFNSNKDETSAKEQSNRIEKIISYYWTDNIANSEQLYAVTKGSLLSQLSDTERENNVKYGGAAVDYSITSTSVKKVGPKIARLSISYKATISALSSNYIYTPADIKEFTYYNDSKSDEEYTDASPASDQSADNNSNPSKQGKFTYTSEATIEMVRKNGEWKIANWDGYIKDSSFSNINE